MAQRSAPLDSDAGSIPHNVVAAPEASTALVDAEAGMTDGNSDPSDENFIIKIFNQLAALCTRVEADEYEIEVPALPARSLQTVLGQFPQNGLYRYISDAKFVLTKDELGKFVLTLPDLRVQFPFFKVIDQPKIVGSAVRAKVSVWVPHAGLFKEGFATLSDTRGDLAILVRKPHAMQHEQFHDQAPRHKGDVDPGMNIGVDWGKKLKLLGKGSFGKVWKTTIDLNDGEKPRLVAVKEPMDDDLARELLVDEVHVMQDVEKVAAIKSFAVQPVYSQRNPPLLAMEFAPYGDLVGKTPLIQRHPACFWRILLQVCNVFWNMPMLNHRDIKPENIMLFPSASGTDLNFKLGDFGIATNNGDTSIFGGSPGYMPPEALPCPPNRVCGPQTVTRQADVFGLGVTVLNMILGNGKSGAVDIRVCKGRINCDWQKGTKLIWQTVATIMNEYKQKFFRDSSANGVYLDKLEDILKLMTHPDPGKRGRFSELDPVLKGYMKFGDYSCPSSLVTS